MNFNKNVFTILCALSFSITLHAQASEEPTEPKKRWFKKENLFTGGTVGLGFGQGSFSLGLSPYFGYSINKYIDVAVSGNYNYVSQRDPTSLYKIRQSILGPGAFTRIYPLKFLFVQAQYEINFIQQKEFNGSTLNYVSKFNAESFLIGPGYASGRDEDSRLFYYISVLFDVGGNKNSPYTDQFGRIDPVIRAGLNIPLFQGSYGDGGSSSRSGTIEKY
jgi:hypothetical protein